MVNRALSEPIGRLLLLMVLDGQSNLMLIQDFGFIRFYPYKLAFICDWFPRAGLVFSLINASFLKTSRSVRIQSQELISYQLLSSFIQRECQQKSGWKEDWIRIKRKRFKRTGRKVSMLQASSKFKIFF